ncbi:hypothetical protein J8N05_45565 [Streptomyces sp. BH-SS-21]|uniref:Uncharacterized protein n=1 Tax=Streptomyces liliiviolaceus TaxID=2823109 RepID=A0A940Y8Z7_9ACTN|nr:hypothetical protein [Streptomyces liliiviolaceus]MBQ0855441.1 hypothetical protein [Streptomyces liliiviolaceus]
MALATPHPAGRDTRLSRALEDLRLGRWLETKTLLEDTNTWDLWCSRSQVLGRGAVGTGAIAAWCEEEPDNYNAWMMRARELSEAVVIAHKKGVDRRDLMQAVLAARYACDIAEERWPQSPVPHLSRMALAQVDLDPRDPHDPMNWLDRKDMLPRGPWRLLRRVDELDPHNREGFHRMLALFHARGDEGVSYAQYVATSVPDGSPLKLLPHYAFVEQFRLRWEDKQTLSVLAYWVSEDKVHYIRRALEDWFELTQPEKGHPDTRSLLDLNHLAHGLTATGVGRATDVFDAIGPHVTKAPWAQVAHTPGEWREDFLKARRPALEARGRR